MKTLTPKELIQTAMQSNRPVAQAIGVFEREITESPELKELLRAVFMVYLMEKYPKVRFCPIWKGGRVESHLEDRSGDSLP